MAETKYTFDIATQTAGGAVSSDLLLVEVVGAALGAAVVRIDTAAGVLDVWMANALSSGDAALLTGVVAAHNPGDFTFAHNHYEEVTVSGKVTSTAWYARKVGSALSLKTTSTTYVWSKSVLISETIQTFDVLGNQLSSVTRNYESDKNTTRKVKQ